MGIGNEVGIGASIAGILALLFTIYQVVINQCTTKRQQLSSEVTASLNILLLDILPEENTRQLELSIYNFAKAHKPGYSDQHAHSMATAIASDIEAECFKELSAIHLNSYDHANNYISVLVPRHLAPVLQKLGISLLRTSVETSAIYTTAESMRRDLCQFVSDHLSRSINAGLGGVIQRHIQGYPAGGALIDLVPPIPPLTNHTWIKFIDSDRKYQEWVEGHPNGFIINTARTGPPPNDDFVLHKATCGSVTNFKTHRPGAFTEYDYIKICADDIDSLREWIKTQDKPSGEFTRACGLCRPLGKIATLPVTKSVVPIKPIPEHQSVPKPLDKDREALLAACQKLPKAQGNYLINDYVENLLLTVIDFMLQTPVVVKAQRHFIDHEKSKIRTYGDLQRLLDSESNTQEGNTKIAQRIWGYKLHTRIGLLRGLVEFFGTIGVTDQEKLKEWASTSEFKDFAGQVKGLGFAVYQYLVMRQGVETVKPDIHVTRFVTEVLGHSIPQEQIVVLLQEAAKTIGVKSYELDWAIWESQRAKASAVIPV